MAKFTERLDIKMTAEDMQLLAERALKADKPLTVYAREIIVERINPLFGGSDASSSVEGDKPHSVED